MDKTLYCKVSGRDWERFEMIINEYFGGLNFDTFIMSMVKIHESLFFAQKKIK